MSRHTILSASLVAAALLALPAAQAATMTKGDYKAGKTRISADVKADKAACKAQAGNAKDICVQEAKARESVSRAELEYGYTGKADDRNKVLVAKAESAYAVAKQRCDDQAGNAKSVCVKQAKADEVSALADAKLGREIGAARKDAATDKRDAEYDLAAQKCDAWAGDAKANCITAAKAQFGKT